MRTGRESAEISPALAEAQKFKACCLSKTHDSLGILGKDEFAHNLIGRIRESKYAGKIDYDPTEYRLSELGSRELHLINAYKEYCSEPESGRDAVLQHWAKVWCGVKLCYPDTYEAAAHALLPVVRERDYVMNYSGGIHAYRVVTEHHSVHLALDFPDTMIDITQDCLDKWGVDFSRAFQMAVENLRQRSPLPGFTRHFGNFYVSTYSDEYDSSRVLLPELLARLDLQGDPVAMIPNPKTLVVAGADDEDGLAAMAQFTASLTDKPRFRSGIPLRFIDGGWHAYRPPVNHPSSRVLNELRMSTISSAYAWQKQTLDEKHRLEDSDVFVASYLVFRDEAAMKNLSVSTWTESISTLLPRTDLVSLCPSTLLDQDPETMKLDEHERPVIVPWDILQKAVGNLMEPMGFYPERYRVSEYPNPEQLRILRTEDVLHGKKEYFDSTGAALP